MPDIIRQVATSAGNHDISALYIQNGTANKTWADIEALVTAGFTIVAPWTKTDYESTTAPTTAKLATVPAVTIYYNSGASSATGTLAATATEATKHIYLIYHPVHDPSEKDVFDEYISTGSAWEKIGNTDVDLSSKADHGTYNTSGTALTTDSAGAATITTSSAGAHTASGTATITYQKADSATGSAGAATITSSSAGAATVNGSSFSFTGTAGTISIETQEKELEDHSYTPEGTISNTYTSADTDTVNHITAAALSATPTFTGEEGDISVSGTVSVTGSYTKAATVTGSAGAATITSSSAGGATITSSSAGSQTASGTATITYKKSAETTGAGSNHNHLVTTHSHNAAVTAVTGYPNFSGGSASGTFLASATVNSSGVLSWTTGDVSWTAASLGTASTVSAAGTTNVATLTTTSEGAHTHAITLTDTAVTGTAAVSVSSHTHSVTVGNHTHSVTVANHTHTIGGTATDITSTGSVTLTGTFTPEGTVSKPDITLTKSTKTFNTNAIKAVTSTFAGTTATLAHTFGAASTVTLTGTYTPEGTIGGSQTINGHTHSVTIGNHTHSIGSTATAVTGTAAVAVASHTHSVTVANHTHSIASHTHSVTI